MPEWQKLGCVFRFKEPMLEGGTLHAGVPFAMVSPKDPSRLRVYCTTRDSQNRSCPTYFECAEADPTRILKEPTQTVMELGDLGAMDDSGIMSSSVVPLEDGRLRLYYIGWTPAKTVSHKLSIFAAESSDGGESFQRVSRAPVRHLSKREPFFSTAPFVIKLKEDLWRMYYVCCTKWEVINGHPEPSYRVHTVTSADGLNWPDEGTVAIDYKEGEMEAIGRPCVWFQEGKWHMQYSFRLLGGYRNNPSAAYHLGYAISDDGVQWEIRNQDAGIPISENVEDWDGVMATYSHVIQTKSGTYSFYNGTGFGQTGIGCARLKSL